MTEGFADLEVKPAAIQPGLLQLLPFVATSVVLLPALPSLRDSFLEMLHPSVQRHSLVSQAHPHQSYCSTQGYSHLQSCRNRSRDDEIESELVKSVDFLAGAYSR